MAEQHDRAKVEYGGYEIWVTQHKQAYTADIAGGRSALKVIPNGFKTALDAIAAARTVIDKDTAANQSGQKFATASKGSIEAEVNAAALTLSQRDERERERKRVEAAKKLEQAKAELAALD